MGSRAELQALFEDILEPVGGKAYHQPPSNIQMEYPAIVYVRDDIRVKHADNAPYNKRNRWLVTFITKLPSDDTVPDQIADLPLCKFVLSYNVGQLKHSAFQLFF